MTNNPKKAFITEEGISTLLQRYKPTTILALLQEVFQSSEVKIDWKALVKKTATGISNVREYQMLWRHLAYRHNLVEKLQDGREPLDDDSDLDHELDACPPVSAELSIEAAACVKVLMVSCLPTEPSIPNSMTVEALLTINIPDGQSSKVPRENTLPTSHRQGSGINGLLSSSHPNRRKRKRWSKEEDLELIAAVKKCGERNWANILKGDFKGDRTSLQLAQRWAAIRKRQSRLNVNSSSSQLSEAQIATRRAIDMALNDSVMAPCAGNGAVAGNSAIAGTSNHGMLSTSNDEFPAVNNSSQSQLSQHRSINPTSKTATLGLTENPRPPPKKVPLKPTISPDSMVKAAAVAAGACIASPLDAATLFKAAQAKNAVHSMPVGGVGSLIKPPVAGSGNLLPSTHLPGHPNVHYFRTSMVATTSSPMPAGGHQVRGNVSLPQSAKVAAALTPTLPSQQSTAVTSSPAIEHQERQDMKSAEDMKAPCSNTKPIMGVQEDLASISDQSPGEQSQKDQSVLLLLEKEAVAENQTAAQFLLGTERAEDEMHEVNDVVENKDANGNDEKAVQSSSEQSTVGKPQVAPNLVGDGVALKMEVPSKAVPGDETVDQ